LEIQAFTLLIILISFIIILDIFNISIVYLPLDRYDFTNNRHEYLGKVVKIEEKKEKTNFEISLISYDGIPVKSTQKILLTKYEVDSSFHELFNEEITFNVQLKEASVRRNPKTFDYRKYLLSKGIGLIGTLDSFEVTGEKLNILDKYEKLLYLKRIEFKEILLEKSKGIIMGLIFGDTSEMEDDVYDDFRKNGTAHILAVSGLHIGLIYDILNKILKNKKKLLRTLIIFICLFTYGTLSMWSPSTIRAELMIGLKIAAELLDFRYDMLNSLGISGIILIASNPCIVFGTSFQMSFLAIASIAFVSPNLRGKVSDLILISLSVNLGLIMYQAYNFNYISLTSIIANIPVIYITAFMVPAAIIAFVLVSIGFKLMPEQIITESIPNILETLSNFLIKVNSFSTFDGKGAIEVVSPPLIFVFIYMLLLMLFTSEIFYVLKMRKAWKEIKRILCFVISFSLFISIGYYEPVSRCDLIFIDVGQGDSLHINCGSEDILIDGGGNYNYNIGENTLKPYLLKNGNWNVDLALATHEHMDHYQGLIELNDCYNITEIRSRLKKGDFIEMSKELYIETLWPLDINEKTGQNENSECSVFMVTYKGYRILVTGDLDEEGEKCLLEMYSAEELKADILKIGHHGSKTSSSLEFIKAVDPQYAVISVGKNNYGHPSPITIEKLENLGIMVLDTLSYGAIGFELKKSKITYHTMLN